MSPAESWRDSRLKRFEVALIAGVVAPLARLLGATWRYRTEGREHFDRLSAEGRPVIIGFWHGRILPGSYYFRNRGIVVITSQNFDGEWIARVIARLGYGTARGSSSRNASGALREMIRHMRAGRSTAFTLDGPRGPAHQAKSGAVWLASATGHPILPFHVEASRAWTLGSWDRAQVPKPFSTAALVFGEPLYVPRDIDEQGIEACRQQLEARLARLVERARDLAGRSEP